jgi:hypothetical protein
LGKQKAPKAPDPYAVAAAQTKSNKETAEYNAALNRIDQSNPYSSVSYTQNGVDPKTGAPIYKQSTTFTPQLQGLFDSQMNTQQGIADATTNLLGLLPQQAFDPNSVGDQSDIRKRSFDSQMAMLKPQFEEGWKNLEGTMSDRGIPIGSEVWQGETTRFDTARDGAQLAAARSADQDASNEHQRLLGNALQQYNMPYQQLSALMGNGQAAGTGSQSPFAQSQSAGTDVAGNIWNAYNANVNRANQSNGQLWNGIAGVGQAALMMSDVRLKRDIKRIGALPSGLPTYEFRYLWSDDIQTGVMAQEAMRMFPDAVVMHDSGYLAVDYSKLA